MEELDVLARQDTDMVHSLTCQTRLESLLRDVEAKEVNTQETEASSCASTASETHRVFARNLKDVDVTEANLDQSSKMRRITINTSFADPIPIPSETSDSSSASNSSVEVEVEQFRTVKRPSEQRAEFCGTQCKEDASR